MRVRINKDEPTAAQRQALKKECVKEFNGLLAIYNQQAAIQVLHILRFDYGFGYKRLKEFSDRLKSLQDRTTVKYELEQGETVWLCKKELEESGIDLKEFLEE